MNARDYETLRWLRDLMQDMRDKDMARPTRGECAKALTLVRRIMESNPRINTQLNAEVDAPRRGGRRAQP